MCHSTCYIGKCTYGNDHTACTKCSTDILFLSAGICLTDCNTVSLLG